MPPVNAAFAKIVTTNTSATSLVVGGATGASSTGTGGIVAGNAALSQAAAPSIAPLTLRGGGSAGDYTLVNSGIVFKNAAGVEQWRIWGTDPDDANFNTQNLYIGQEAGLGQPTDNTSAGGANTGIGALVMQSVTTGSGNVAIGVGVLGELTTGGANVCIGSFAGGSLVTDSGNTFVGDNSGDALTDGTGNTGLGHVTLISLVHGDFNTAVGEHALNALAGGSNSDRNTAVGKNAGLSFGASPSDLLLSNNSTFIGADTRALLNNSTNEVVIGYGTIGAGDNTATIGNVSVTHLYTPRTIIAKYDASNYLSIAVSSAGAVTIDATGASAGVTFADAVACSADITLATSKKLQFGAGADTWIGETTTDQVNVQAGGSGGVYLASGGTSWTGVSDERLKTDLTPMADAMARLNLARTVMGRFKTDEDTKRRPFLLAQDWQSILPSVVDVAEDGTLGLRQLDILPLVIAALKEVDARVRALETR